MREFPFPRYRNGLCDSRAIVSHPYFIRVMAKMVSRNKHFFSTCSHILVFNIATGHTSLGGGRNRWHALSYSDDFDNSDNFDMIEDFDNSGNTDRLGKL